MNLFILSVSAEGFYTNRYGVSFSEQEYSFISNFYFDGYQNFMSIDDYNDFIDSDIMNGEITIVEKKLIDEIGNVMFYDVYGYIHLVMEKCSKCKKL